MLRFVSRCSKYSSFELLTSVKLIGSKRLLSKDDIESDQIDLCLESMFLGLISRLPVASRSNTPDQVGRRDLMPCSEIPDHQRQLMHEL